MIRPLRRLHLPLAAGLLAGTVAAIVTAAGSAGPSSVAPRISGQPAGPETIVAGLGIALATLADSGGTLVSARATGPLGVSDPLLYYVDAPSTDSASLPADARFLGALTRWPGSPTRHARGTLRPGGSLVLWSHGHRRVVATAPFPRVAGAEP